MSLPTSRSFEGVLNASLAPVVKRELFSYLIFLGFYCKKKDKETTKII